MIQAMVRANANIYLANGEYNLDKAKSIEQVNFIGSDANSTVIKYTGVAFRVWNSLTLTNLTISDATIMNYVTLNATNTIFAHASNSNRDSYGNNFGGAINCPYYSSSYTPTVNIKNCTFLDNYAEYGGAIYMDGGSLDIIDTMFINNFAYNFGGAIAAENGVKISISKSKFFNSYSMADAGGAIYARSSELKLSNVEISNSSATFGGAFASLDTSVSLNYLNVKDCSAKWDGGAIYHLYGNFSSYYGTFINNSANNGGAIFVDNSTAFILRSNQFTNNTANLTAGAVYSICNTLKGMVTVKQFNRFNGNKAFFKDNEYESSSINLTIGNGNYTMYKNNASEVMDLPSYYSLRDYNLLTIPKDQQSSGNCWAFTAIAVLESNILKAVGESLDLSEENMKNVIAKFSDYGWKIETNDGGYANMPFGYFAGWLGPVYEYDDVFDDHSTLSPLLNSVIHVQNIKFLKRDNYLDNDEIKKAILQYGAVGTSMLFDNNFFRGNGYYCWSSNPSNHAVTIVGWDDNYSRSNFYGLPQDCGNGAWIVRNSWGPNWNDKGYFYVSYYDVKFAQPGVDAIAYTFILNDTIKYDKNYQYDIAGSTDYFYTGDETLWYRNNFTADSDEFLAGISTYFEKVTNWTATVYVNGEIKVIKEGISNPGYYTFDLGKLISLKSGDTFGVEFKVTNSNIASIPISEYYSLEKLIYKPGISFMSRDGVNWEDLYYASGSYATHTYYSQVACIKAFTILNEIDTITDLVIDYDGYNPVNITATVMDQYGNLLNDGNITFNLSGNEIIVNVSNGIAKITHIFEEGLNAISATFNGIGYKSSADASEIIVNSLINTTLSGDSLVMSYRDGSSWVVTLTDVNGNAIVGVPVRIGIKIGSRNVVYSRVTDGGGSVGLPINLAPGSYAINATFDGIAHYKSSFISSTVTVNKADLVLSGDDLVMSYRDGSSWVVTLTDVNGNAVAGASVRIGIKIGSKDVVYRRVTDANGSANLQISLAVGSYAVNATFEGNNFYNPTDVLYNVVTVEKMIPVISADDLIMTYKDGSKYEVKLLDSNGKAIVNAPVKFIICNTSYYVKTDSNGISKLPINLGKGEYTITASFGDNNYQYVETTNNIKVILKSSITANDINMTYRDGTSYDVQLVDDGGNPIALSGITVKITVCNKTYNVLTNVNGTAKLPINLWVGHYDISAQYGNAIVNNTITINKAN